MTLVVPRSLAAALACGLLSLAGCGGAAPDKSNAGPGDKDTAQDLLRLLQDYAEMKKRPLNGPAELGDAAATHPLGAAAIANQSYVVVWKAPITPGSTAVLAYQKDTPTKGGTVILQDGTLKEMTAEEFNGTPKAK